MQRTVKPIQSRDNVRLLRLSSILAITAVTLLAVGMMYYNFLSQKRLQSMTVVRLEESLAGRAKAVNYFFMERKNDMRELAASSSVNGYFTNRALGMSLEYGLRGSLQLIQRDFQHLDKSGLSNLRTMYTRLVLFATDGEMLVEYQGVSPCPVTGCNLQEITKTASSDAPLVQLDKSNPSFLLFTSAVRQQDEIVGYIAGWVSLTLIHEQFLETVTPEQEGLNDILFIYVPDNPLSTGIRLESSQKSELLRRLSQRAAVSDGKDTSHSFLNIGGDTTKYILVSSRLMGRDMSLIHLLEQQHVFDFQAPYRTLLGMLLAGLMVLGIALLAIRLNTRARVLGAKLDESDRQQQIIAQINRDLSLEVEQRRRAEHQLAEEKERLELVVYAADTGIWEWKVQTGKTTFNERWAGIVGYTLAELEPVSIHTWVALCHPDDFNTADSLLKKHFKGEIDFYDFECRMRHKDGHWVWVHDRGSVVEWSQDGLPLRMSGIHSDISSRKHAEMDLVKAHDTLEERVKERTEELARIYSRLAMQEKMASVGQLAAGLAHELNNPINFVQTNFAALVDDINDLLEIIRAYQYTLKQAANECSLSAQVAQLSELEQALNLDYLLTDIPVLFDESEKGFVRIGKIIQSMRDFSRVDNVTDRSWYNINRGIEDTLTIARNEYKYCAEIKTQLGSLPELYCNPEQLNQVFLNLIVNSSHALASMADGHKGVISITTSHTDDAVFCEIADNGPGIDEEHRKRIFEPFYTTKDPGKGTGLGLSISYDIVVNKHHGELTVHCPEAGGTVFTIRLPRNMEEPKGTP
jgi:PAS domain S-box-containing protein